MVIKPWMYTDNRDVIIAEVILLDDGGDGSWLFSGSTLPTLLWRFDLGFLATSRAY